MLDPNSGGIVFSDDLWMVDIPGVYLDLDILQDLTLDDSIAAEKLAIEVSVDEDTKGSYKYDFLDISHFIHSIPGEEK